MVAAADGDSARALAKYDEARARLEAELKRSPPTNSAITSPSVALSRGFDAMPLPCAKHGQV